MDRRPSEVLQAVLENVEKVVVGKRSELELTIVALAGQGHVLIEDVPGVGKTVMAKSLARSLGCSFKRIQFTPDLLPSDVTGVSIYNQRSEEFEFRPGPVVAQVVLADEINRATPKTQAALLEAMQEQTVSVATTVHKLPRPFFVLATQNPIEMEGTYPLPEAELDRFFFKLNVGFPTREQMNEIIRRTTSTAGEPVQRVADGRTLQAMQALGRQVPIASHVTDYAVRIVMATHPDDPDAPEVTTRYVRYGASPRAAQAIVLAAKILALLNNRLNVSFEDVRRVAPPALRHRVLLNFEAESKNVTPDTLIRQVLQSVKEGG